MEEGRERYLRGWRLQGGTLCSEEGGASVGEEPVEEGASLREEPGEEGAWGGRSLGREEPWEGGAWGAGGEGEQLEETLIYK